MTIKKVQHNRAALGVMGVVLLFALVSAGRSLFSGGSQPRSTIAAVGAQPDSQLPDSPTTAAGTLSTSDRDPFSSPRLEAASVKLLGPAVPPETPFHGGLRQTMPVRPGLSQLPPAPGLTPIGGAFRVQPLPATSGAIDAAAAAGAEQSLVRSLRVTAIVMGANSYVVVESVGVPPRTLHKSEMLKTLRLVVIRPGEVVLKGESGIWTLPLATPDSETTPTELHN